MFQCIDSYTKYPPRGYFWNDIENTPWGSLTIYETPRPLSLIPNVMILNFLKYKKITKVHSMYILSTWSTTPI